MAIAYRSKLSEASSPTELSVAIESIRLRAAQTAHSGPIVVVIAALFGAALAWLGAGWYGIVWSLLVITAAGTNWYLCHRLKRTRRSTSAADAARLEHTLWWLTVGNTAAMATGIWLLSAAGVGIDLLYAMTMIQSLYSLGALINASTHPPTFIVGTWINLGSSAVYWFFFGLNGAPVGLTLLGLAFVMTRFSHQIYAEFIQSVRIRYENADLLEQLRAQVSVADAARTAAEEANQAKSRFLAAASHDLRQPLHSLLLFTSLLEKGSPENQVEFMRHIHTAAGSLDKLFSSLLDLSKLDSGAISTNVGSVDLAAMTDELEKTYSVMAASKGLSLKVQAMPGMVETDAFLLERILRNLLDNAIKYTKTGSITLSARQLDDQVAIRVSDTGIGIPAPDQASIFDEFHRTSEGKLVNSSGSGLGLAIVSRLCKLLDHRLELSSTPDAGSTFTLTLKAATPTPLAYTERTDKRDLTTTAEPDSLSLDASRIVVVDDDLSICRAMAAVVESMGATPVTYTTVEEVVDAFALEDALRPFAVISDYRFGGPATGVDVITTIRNRFPEVPAVIVSGDIHSEPVALTSLDNVKLLRKPVGEQAIRLWLANVAKQNEHPHSSTTAG